MLSLEMFSEDAWRPPVMRTVATSGAGVADLIAMIEQYRQRTSAALTQRRRARSAWRLREILGRRFVNDVEQNILAKGEFDRLLDAVTKREVDPYKAADSVMARAMRQGAGQAPGLSGVEGGMPLDHIGIAVKDAAAFAALFAKLANLSTGEAEIVGPHRLRFVDAGGATLELVEAVTDEAPVAKYLAKRGESLHHLCFRVPDIDAAIARLVNDGVKMIDVKPRKGAHGARIAFIHPSSAGGLLIELKQLASGAGHA
jgi:methylmalonyl-CoA epimerase